jgi:hypothetical protein
VLSQKPVHRIRTGLYWVAFTVLNLVSNCILKKKSDMKTNSCSLRSAVVLDKNRAGHTERSGAGGEGDHVCK